MRPCGCGERGRHRLACPTRAGESPLPGPPPQPTELRALALRAAAGDRAAEAVVMAAAEDSLRGMVRRKFRPLESRYDDLVMEARIGALKGLRRYAEASRVAPLTWMIQTAIWAVKDALRANRSPIGATLGSRARAKGREAWDRHPLDIDATFKDGQEHKSHEPADPRSAAAVRDVEDRDQLERLFRFLRRRDREILELHLGRGIPLRVVGEIVGLTESRVFQIERDALARLREVAGAA